MTDDATTRHDAIIAEFQDQLDAWEVAYAGRPQEELTQLWLLALEREQIVTVAYRRDIIEQRLTRMPVSDDVRRAVNRAVRWAWRDEERHALYMRGVLLQKGLTPDRLRTWRSQFEGLIAGWTSSRQNHHTWAEKPFTRALAETFEIAGALAGKIPAPAREALRYSSFADFCRFNIAAERTAGMGWQRIAALSAAHPELGVTDDDVAAFRSIAADEDRHAAIFALFAESFDEDDRLREGLDADTLIARLAAVGQRFIAVPRPGTAAWRNPLGKGAPVLVRKTRGERDAARVLETVLDEVGVPARLDGQRVAIMTAFMMVAHKRDLSPGVSPALLKALGRALARRGADVTVLECGNIFERYHAGRSVHEVAAYLGLDDPAYRIVSTEDVLAEHTYQRGLDLKHIAMPWRDADHRLLFGKLRGHPTTGAMLALEVAEHLGGRNEAYQFGDRRADRETVVAMILDAFPPDLALVDATSDVPDGLTGVMGSEAPRHPRRLYASRDAVSLDVVLARHLGAEPGDLAMVDTCKDWFGDPSDRLTVDGIDAPIEGWRRHDRDARTAALAKLAMPFYAHISAQGELFLPDFDETTFPPLEATSAPTAAARTIVRAITRDDAAFAGLLPTRTLTVRGHTVRVAQSGDGPPLVLLHGYPETLQLFARLLPHLARRFTAYAFDWPGQGYSDRWPGPCDPSSRADQLGHILDALGLDRAHLVAADMGAHPALAFAARNPQRVGRLVVMNALLYGDGPTSLEIAVMRRAGLASLAFRHTPRVVYLQCKRTFLPSGAHWPDALDDDFLPPMLAPSGAAFLADLCAETEPALADLPDLYPLLSCPTLALWAQRDAHFPVAQAERFAQHAPTATLDVLPDAHHWMTFTRARDLAQRIIPFLEEGTP